MTANQRPRKKDMRIGNGYILIRIHKHKNIKTFKTSIFERKMEKMESSQESSKFATKSAYQICVFFLNTAIDF